MNGVGQNRVGTRNLRVVEREVSQVHRARGVGEAAVPTGELEVVGRRRGSQGPEGQSSRDDEDATLKISTGFRLSDQYAQFLSSACVQVSAVSKFFFFFK